MKKFLLLALAIGMATATFAQKAITVTITPAQGETLEKIKVSPDSYTLVYFEKEKTKNPTYYAIIRPTEGFDLKAFKLFSGTIQSMTEVSGTVFDRDTDIITIKNPSKETTIILSRFSDGKLITKKDTVELIKLPRE